jgi:hypothetical protein
MSSAPTFVARFADGEVTRMTTHTPLDPLDVGRGVKLARHAYRSRKKLTAPTPAIVEAHFEQDGSTIATYDAVTLADVCESQKDE